MKRQLITFIFSLFVATTVSAQGNTAYIQYVETYKQMAIDQMKRHRVPASITLAQGILESNAGRSELATKANNHFGIKVGGNWTGPYIVKSDDRPDDKFRKYKSVAESYEDHSLFLQKQRYASLFQLDPTDYEGWAYGLKAAGYATNPKYPSLLIGLIRDYDLAQYDRPSGGSSSHNLGALQHRLFLCNDIAYVRVREGDTFASIAREVGIREKRLRRYNEVGKGYVFHEGDVVYLKKKKSHVAKGVRGNVHVVTAGQSLYAISQMYGIRLSKLYSWNRLPADYCPVEGDRLVLR